MPSAGHLCKDKWLVVDHKLEDARQRVEKCVPKASARGLEGDSSIPTVLMIKLMYMFIKMSCAKLSSNIRLIVC
jgi:hypothetical protein